MNKLCFLLLFILAIIIAPIACLQDNPAMTDYPGSKTIELVKLGQLPGALVESSGIAITSPGKIWTHNDSGGRNELYCIDHTGALLRTIKISNATNVDWEDLATDSHKRIYIGDFGKNSNNRNDLVILRIPDPESYAENEVTAENIRFNLEDQIDFPPAANARNFYIEAVFWKQDSLFMFTKDRSKPITGFTKMYVIPALPGEHTARLKSTFYIGSNNSSARVTAPDLHLKSGKMVLLLNEKLVVFTDYPGNRFFEGKVTEYPFKVLPGQAEAIVFSDPFTLFMTEEGSSGVGGNLYKIDLAK